MSISEKLPITDSPWLWVLMFSVVGLGAIAAIHVKYGQRQANLERQYQARERVGESESAVADRRGYATSDANLVPLWPLVIVLSGVAALAAAMLVRGHFVRGQTTAAQRCPRPGSLDEDPPS